MAYENVDTTQLRNALNECLNSLDSSKLESISEGLTDEVWTGSAKNNLKSALDKLASTRYENLKDKISSYLSEVDKIETYKENASSASDLNSQKTRKEHELKLEKNKVPKNQTKINKLQNEINELNTKISNLNVSNSNISIDL